MPTKLQFFGWLFVASALIQGFLYIRYTTRFPDERLAAVLFILVLLINLGTGVFYLFRARRKNGNDHRQK